MPGLPAQLAMLIAVTACAVLYSAPTRAAGTVRYRADGNICTEATSADTEPFLAIASEGFWQYGMLMPCPIPTGPALVELHDGNARLLEKISLRLEQTGTSGSHNETTTVKLITHDYDSALSCECDVDTRTGGNGFFSPPLVLELAGDGGAQSPGCSASTCPGFDSAWAVDIQLDFTDTAGLFDDQLKIRLLSVYDT